MTSIINSLKINAMKQKQFKLNSTYLYYEDLGDSIVLYDVNIKSLGKGYITALICNPDGCAVRKLFPVSSLGEYNIISSIDELIKFTKKPISNYFTLKY